MGKSDRITAIATVRDVFALLILIFGAFTGLALGIPRGAGALGEDLGSLLTQFFGNWLVWLIPTWLITSALLLYFDRLRLCMGLTIVFLLAMSYGTVVGGYFGVAGTSGASIQKALIQTVGDAGYTLILATTPMLVLLWLVRESGAGMGSMLTSLLAGFSRMGRDDFHHPEDISGGGEKVWMEGGEVLEPIPKQPDFEGTASGGSSQITKRGAPAADRATNGHKYHLPLDLLDDPKPVPEPSRDEVERKGQTILQIVERLARVKPELVQVTWGGRLLRFELMVPAYTDLNRLRNLSDNLAMALASQGDVMITAPVPGKNTVLVEVPRHIKVEVSLKEMLASPAFANAKSSLAFVLGKSVEGEAMVANLDDLPHLLIGGATGSGKSVFLNSLALSLMYLSPPSRVRLILIDPKQVDFSGFEGIPHLLVPIITKPKEAVKALEWAVHETQRRYELLKQKGYANLREYHAKEKDRIPYVVIIIDELNYLLKETREGRDVERYFGALSQIARAAGIHLAVATQRPDARRIEGGIKANLPARISFKLSSKVDSITILDTVGAEKLLGRGDMLVILPDSDKPIRLQAPYVSPGEISRVVRYAIEQYGIAQYDHEVMESLRVDEEEEISLDDLEEDAGLMQEIRDFLMGQEEVSVSLLQRKFRIGYNKASRLMDLLERLGWVEGKKENIPGQKTRKVLL
ncbi:MAG: DNA translocase FtsK [bacterium JZ-2024 1]